MAVSIADIQKLRKMSGAGLADCKKALEEAESDFDKAMEIIRKRGQAIAAKRSDRDASEGCVLVKVDGNFGAIIALKCETDFVASNADFIKLAQDILDAAVAARCKTLEEVNALPMGDMTIAEAVTARSGVTGEKMELDGYMTLEAPALASYNHMSKNFLCTLVAFNKEMANAAAGHEVAMQVAAMNPVAVDEASVPAEVKEREMTVAVEKTKLEQCQKAVEAALKKAGYNLYTAENEEHIAEGIAKGYITEAQADDIRRIKTEVFEQKAATLPAQMVENIARGRMAKFYKESCLLNQDYIQDTKITVADFLKKEEKDLTVTAFRRFSLRAE
ncbi:MAG: elongation factor Ts [Bacteroidaceae bacterium]|jgi:elongation factor Ts|nr:elongation factor Ts [Bacteroidaceae bacterium]